MVFLIDDFGNLVLTLHEMIVLGQCRIRKQDIPFVNLMISLELASNDASFLQNFAIWTIL